MESNLSLGQDGLVGSDFLFVTIQRLACSYSHWTLLTWTWLLGVGCWPPIPSAGHPIRNKKIIKNKHAKNKILEFKVLFMSVKTSLVLLRSCRSQSASHNNNNKGGKSLGHCGCRKATNEGHKSNKCYWPVLIFLSLPYH